MKRTDIFSKIMIILFLLLIGSVFFAAGWLKSGAEIFNNTIINFVTAFVASLFILLLICGGIISAVLKNKKHYNTDKITRILEKQGELSEKNYGKFFGKGKKIITAANVYFYFVFIITFLSYCAFCCLIYNTKFSFVLPAAVSGITLYSLIEFFFTGTDELDKEHTIYSELYPELISSVINSAKAYSKSKKINVYWIYDDAINCYLDKGEMNIYIGLSALQLLSEKELSAEIKAKSAVASDIKIRRTEKVLGSTEKWQYFSFDSDKIIFSRLLLLPLSSFMEVFMPGFEMAAERETVSYADKIIGNFEFKQDYLNGEAKQALFAAFDGETGLTVNNYLYSDIENFKHYSRFSIEMFIKFYEKFGAVWNEELLLKIPGKLENNITFSRKMKELNLSGYNISFSDCSGDVKNLVALADGINYDAAKDIYEDKKEKFGRIKDDIFRYENNPENFTERKQLVDISSEYRITGDFIKSEAILDALIKNGDTTSETLFYKACLLLAGRNDDGVAMMYKVMENNNYLANGIDILGNYLLRRGKVKEFGEYKKFKDRNLNLLVNEMPNDFLTVKNTEFLPTKMSVEVITAIIKTLKKDDNITKIYVADTVMKSGKSRTVFAFKVRNNTDNAFYETYDRMFSCLDNEYGKYDTYLISLDREPEFLPAFEKTDGSLKYEY